MSDFSKGPVIETHPLKPFLPHEGRILFLGSFPPPKARWYRMPSSSRAYPMSLERKAEHYRQIGFTD